MRKVIAVLAVASWLIASPRLTGAQPVLAQDPFPQEGRGSPSTTRIPVTMPASPEVLGTDASVVAPPGPSISVEEPVDPDQYTCGPGDVFDLNFWGPQNFRLRIAANLEGRVFISKVGFVTVAGKTLTTVRKDVHRKVSANYPGLNFELTLVSPRTFIVHVVDFVKQPGSYVAHPLERLSSVLSRAGGTIPTGSRRQIAIHHKTGGDATADLVMYELTGDVAYNPFVLDGDVIRVPHAALTVTIAGAVRRPGSYELVKAKDLAELLELAGGLKSSVAYALPIRVIRRNDHQQEVYRDLAFSEKTAPNAPLLDDDSITVRGMEELQRSVLLIGAIIGADPLDTATMSKRLPYIEGDSVLSLVTRAGGIKAPGDLRRSYISRMHPGAKPEQIPLDLDALLVKRDFSADKPIAMNDTIVIPPMQYSVLVEGAVARSGMYPFNPQFGITEYIAHAGGRSRTARDLDDVKLIDWSGTTHDYSPGLKPSPGDAILVPERNFTRAEIAQIVIAVAGLVVSGVAITIAATR
jgi:protein involved in polysaccharide export with SLBB domain